MAEVPTAVDVKELAAENCSEQSQNMSVTRPINKLWPGDDYW
jgi:hypothetical protein